MAQQEEQLYKVFTNVNEWLKFSEAKNAMLIAFNAASIYGVAQALGLKCIEKVTWATPYLGSMIFIFILSTIICLISFLPKTKILAQSTSTIASTGNVVFYGYLKDKTSDQILHEITGTPLPTPTANFTELEKGLADQIKMNSIITDKKFKFFKVAIIVTLVSYLTVPVASTILFINHFCQ
jgi:hypothetical protein